MTLQSRINEIYPENWVYETCINNDWNEILLSLNDRLSEWENENSPIPKKDQNLIIKDLGKLVEWDIRIEDPTGPLSKIDYILNIKENSWSEKIKNLIIEKREQAESEKDKEEKNREKAIEKARYYKNKISQEILQAISDLSYSFIEISPLKNEDIYENSFYEDQFKVYIEISFFNDNPEIVKIIRSEEQYLEIGILQAIKNVIKKKFLKLEKERNEWISNVKEIKTGVLPVFSYSFKGQHGQTYVYLKDTIFLPKRLIGLFIGKGGNTIKFYSKILGKRITVKELETSPNSIIRTNSFINGKWKTEKTIKELKNNFQSILNL